MQDKLFKELVLSVEQMVAIEKGEIDLSELKVMIHSSVHTVPEFENREDKIKWMKEKLLTNSK